MASSHLWLRPGDRLSGSSGLSPLLPGCRCQSEWGEARSPAAVAKEPDPSLKGGLRGVTASVASAAASRSTWMGARCRGVAGELPYA